MTPEPAERLRERLMETRREVEHLTSKMSPQVAAPYFKRVDADLEALAVLQRRLAEKDEALRAIAEPARTEWLPGEYPLVIARMMELAREALRATPAKEEA